MARAYVVDLGPDGKSRVAGWRDPESLVLMPGNVTVRVRYTTMNYKDALAITGKAPIIRRYPMIPGIDFAGDVTASTDPRFAVGDGVILNGWGVGETHFGGYSPLARVKGDWLLRQPVGLTNAECMAIGTAGYTAMLCLLRLEDLGVGVAKGPILVTGASGGVGSFAVSLLASHGYEVVAATGRMHEADYLRSLGARTILERSAVSDARRPLAKPRFAGAVDVAGGHTLAGVLAQISYGGVVASCGLAEGQDLPTTVMPFILRGVTLAGIDSVMAPRGLRERAWQRLATKLDRRALAEIAHPLDLSEIETAAPELLEGRVRGRLVIRVS